MKQKLIVESIIKDVYYLMTPYNTIMQESIQCVVRGACIMTKIRKIYRCKKCRAVFRFDNAALDHVQDTGHDVKLELKETEK
jgi:hypothetical protein